MADRQADALIRAKGEAGVQSTKSQSSEVESEEEKKEGIYIKAKKTKHDTGLSWSLRVD